MCQLAWFGLQSCPGTTEITTPLCKVRHSLAFLRHVKTSCFCWNWVIVRSSLVCWLSLRWLFFCFGLSHGANRLAKFYFAAYVPKNVYCSQRANNESFCKFWNVFEASPTEHVAGAPEDGGSSGAHGAQTNCCLLVFRFVSNQVSTKRLQNV